MFTLFSIKVHEEKDAQQKEPDTVPEGAIPAYLLDREGVSRTKVQRFIETL